MVRIFRTVETCRRERAAVSDRLRAEYPTSQQELSQTTRKVIRKRIKRTRNPLKCSSQVAGTWFQNSLKSIEKKGVLRNSDLACLNCRLAYSNSKLATDAGPLKCSAGYPSAFMPWPPSAASTCIGHKPQAPFRHMLPFPVQ